jgi:hypothetical protein
MLIQKSKSKIKIKIISKIKNSKIEGKSINFFNSKIQNTNAKYKIIQFNLS